MILYAPLRVREGRLTVSPAVAGDKTHWDYAEKYRLSGSYLEGVAHPGGSGKFWTDPLVVYLRSDHGNIVENLTLSADKGINVAPVIDAVNTLDGLQGGQWPAVARSIEALADALHATGKYSQDRAHLLDIVGYPVAAAYDAATAKERLIAEMQAAEAAEAKTDPRIKLHIDPHLQSPEPLATIRFRKQREGSPLALGFKIAGGLALVALGWYLF